LSASVAREYMLFLFTYQYIYLVSFINIVIKDLKVRCVMIIIGDFEDPLIRLVGLEDWS